MTAIVLFDHHGFQAALPAAQVLRLDTDVDAVSDAPVLSLWPGSQSARGRLLAARAADRTIRLWCEEVRIRSLEENGLMSLPGVVRELLQSMPYVVGAAWIDQKATWLVDLSNFRPGAALE